MTAITSDTFHWPIHYLRQLFLKSLVLVVKGPIELTTPTINTTGGG